jgi:hypothetical protein
MNLSFNRENGFKTENISGIGSKNNDIILEKMGSSSSPSNVQNNNLPRFSNNQIPDRKAKVLRPMLGNNKKVPMDSFGGLANQKKSYANSESSYSGNSSNSNDSDSDSDDEDDGLNSMISSNSSNIQSSSPYKNKYASSNDDDSGSEESSEEEDDDEDGSEEASSYSSGSGSGSEGSVVSSGSEESGNPYGGTGMGMNQGYSQPNRPLTYEEAQRRKQKVLFELDRLQKQGHQPSKKYTMASNLEDMEYERDCLKRQRDLDKSIKFSRKALMMVVSGIEYLNGKFDPFDVKLDGWSEKVMDDINDYDEIFEELHDKYNDSVKMSPELRLMMTLAGSGFMYHLTNSLFKSSTPDLNDILKKNPDIVRSIQEAAIQNMNNGINTQFGANDPIGNMMKQGIQMKAGPPPPMDSRMPPRSPPQMNNMFGPSRPMAPPQRPQPTMRGPTGVDDLLSKLKSGSDNDDTMSESSFNMRSSGRKGGLKKGKNGGVQIDLTE